MQFLTITRTAVDLHPYKLNAILNKYDLPLREINSSTLNSRRQVALLCSMTDELCTFGWASVILGCSVS